MKLEAIFAEQTLRRAYAAFNARDVDAALAVLSPDVEWPDGIDGGIVRGRPAFREYCLRQWERFTWRTEPIGFDHRDGGTAVRVVQILKDKNGVVTADRNEVHFYRFDGGLIRSVEITVLKDRKRSGDADRPGKTADPHAETTENIPLLDV